MCRYYSDFPPSVPVFPLVIEADDGASERALCVPLRVCLFCSGMCGQKGCASPVIQNVTALTAASQEHVWSAVAVCRGSAATAEQATLEGGEQLHPVTHTETARPGNHFSQKNRTVPAAVAKTPRRPLEGSRSLRTVSYRRYFLSLLLATATATTGTIYTFIVILTEHPTEAEHNERTNE